MALGANITALQPYRLREILFKALGEKQHGLGTNRPFLQKAGVPASNTAADDPGEKFAWIYDRTNDHWYLCTAYTNSGSFTLTQIT